MLVIPYVYMAKIIWIGNMAWSAVGDGNQPWDKEITALKLKKLKYMFKSLSAKIIRSKTSYAAKQATGQARRETLRLKNEKSQTS